MNTITTTLLELSGRDPTKSGPSEQRPQAQCIRFRREIIEHQITARGLLHQQSFYEFEVLICISVGVRSSSVQAPVFHIAVHGSGLQRIDAVDQVMLRA